MELLLTVLLISCNMSYCMEAAKIGAFAANVSFHNELKYIYYYIYILLSWPLWVGLPTLHDDL